MKRRDLLKQLDKIAKTKELELVASEGGNHTRVSIGKWTSVIPRHREVNEMLAKAIIRNAERGAE